MVLLWRSNQAPSWLACAIETISGSFKVKFLWGTHRWSVIHTSQYPDLCRSLGGKRILVETVRGKTCVIVLYHANTDVYCIAGAVLIAAYCWLFSFISWDIAASWVFFLSLLRMGFPVPIGCYVRNSTWAGLGIVQSWGCDAAMLGIHIWLAIG